MGAVYRTGARRFLEVVGRLRDADVARPVPACPAWTVHDLLAHLAGSSTDVVSGNVKGAATPPWTARQVDERRRRTVSELVEEWGAHVDAVAATCERPTPNPAWDVAVHLDDLRDALHLPPGPPEDGWGEVLRAALTFRERRSGQTVSVGEDGPDPGTTTWHVATAYGLWRGLFSRLDDGSLEREIVRGDVDGFRRTAFFAG